MDAPYRAGQRHVPPAEVKMESKPVKNAALVIDAKLRKEIENTTAELRKKTFLAKLVKPGESVEESFFRLGDAIHFIARAADQDRHSQAKTAEEEILWECNNLLKLADQLPLHHDAAKLSNIFFLKRPEIFRSDTSIALEISDHLPEYPRRHLRNQIATSALESDDLTTLIEVAKHGCLQDAFIGLQHVLDRFLVRRDVDLHKLADLARNLLEPDRSQMSFKVACCIMSKETVVKAIEYLDSIDFERVPADLIALYSFDTPLEFILHLASKLKPESKGPVLSKIVEKLNGYGQYEKSLEVVKAIPPSVERDRALEGHIQAFLKQGKRDLWVLNLPQLIFSPENRQRIQDSIDIAFPTTKIL